MKKFLLSIATTLFILCGAACSTPTKQAPQNAFYQPTYYPNYYYTPYYDDNYFPGPDNGNFGYYGGSYNYWPR